MKTVEIWTDQDINEISSIKYYETQKNIKKTYKQKCSEKQEQFRRFMFSLLSNTFLEIQSSLHQDMKKDSIHL